MLGCSPLPKELRSDHLDLLSKQFSTIVVTAQSLTCVQIFVTPMNARFPCPLPSPAFAQIHIHWEWCYLNHLILCCPLLLLPSIFPSIRVFFNEPAFHIRWPKYWSFSFSPSNEYSGLTSFRIDWLDLLAVQRTLKSLLQHHNAKTSILQHSAFFKVQLGHSFSTLIPQ